MTVIDFNQHKQKNTNFNLLNILKEPDRQRRNDLLAMFFYIQQTKTTNTIDYMRFSKNDIEFAKKALLMEIYNIYKNNICNYTVLEKLYSSNIFIKIFLGKNHIQKLKKCIIGENKLNILPITNLDNKYLNFLILCSNRKFKWNDKFSIKDTILFFKIVRCLLNSFFDCAQYDFSNITNNNYLLIETLKVLMWYKQTLISYISKFDTNDFSKHEELFNNASVINDITNTVFDKYKK